jgi:3'(2'), 5'-bisphosphate nucleotidase
MVSHRLSAVLDIAAEAAEAVLAQYGVNRRAESKVDGSPLTAADRASHATIVRGLEALTPYVPVISEEGADVAFDERRQWREFWLVDPLDGTKEFLAGNGEFTVNIALIVDGAPVLGVVSAPALGAVYYAERGAGAWRCLDHGRPERICPASGLSGSTRIVESRSHASPELEAFLATLGPVERQALGSSLKFCRVAEGSADLYPRFGRTMEWDVAAGDCIYRHSTLDGSERPSPLRYNQPSLSTPSFVIGCAHVNALAAGMQMS